MIYFMLQNDCRHACQLLNLLFSPHILIFYAYLSRTSHVSVQSRQRKASLFDGNFFCAPESNDRIHIRRILGSLIAHLHDNELDILADLRSRKSDAVRADHGLIHLFGECVKRATELRDVVAGLMQCPYRMFDYRKHRIYLSTNCADRYPTFNAVSELMMRVV